MTGLSKSETLEQREAQEKEAFGKGLFAILRQLEREGQNAPRIGKNARLRESLVRLGQDPYTAFPDTDLARVDMSANPPMLRAQFLGFFGPFGALPLVWTEEVRRWFDEGDPGFVAFTDIFAARFQELFFRAWSDARAITQFDHAKGDRFSTYLLAMVGTGSPAYAGRDTVPDTARRRLVPLAAGRVKSPVRLRQLLQVHFSESAEITIQEMVPAWLEFERNSLSRIGQQAATLGRDTHLGSRVRSISEKITVHVRVPTLAAYDRFLPGGPDYDHLRDLIFWYLGQSFDIDVALWLPEPEVRPAILGESARLGWMACLAPDEGNPDHLARVTRFDLKPARMENPDPMTRAA